MAWNESGGDDKDPWGNRGNQGPPDLDEAIRKLQSQLSGLFGGKGSSDRQTVSVPEALHLPQAERSAAADRSRALRRGSRAFVARIAAF